MTLAVAEAYDDDLEAEDPTRLPGFQVGGFFTHLAPGLAYKSRQRRVRFDVNAGSNFRYYGDRGEFTVMNHSLGVGVTGEITRRTTFFANEAISYSPSYLYSLFGSVVPPSLGDIIPPAADYAIGAEPQRSYTYATSGGVTQGLTRRATISVDSNIRYTEFEETATGYSDFHAIDARGRFQYALNRDLRLHVDYVFRQANYAGARGPTEQNVNVGLDFNYSSSRRPRRTTFTFNVGPTAARDFRVIDSGKQYLLDVDAVLSHQISRSWSLRGSAQRGFAYVDGLTGPVFANRMIVQTTGLLNRRTDLVLSGGYSSGDLAQSGGASSVNTYTGDLRLRVALSRHLAAGVEYFYYYYNFDPSFPLPSEVPHGLTRNGIRVGLTLWAPVIGGRR